MWVPAQVGIVLDAKEFTEMSGMYLPFPSWSLHSIEEDCNIRRKWMKNEDSKVR